MDRGQERRCANEQYRIITLIITPRAPICGIFHRDFEISFLQAVLHSFLKGFDVFRNTDEYSLQKSLILHKFRLDEFTDESNSNNDNEYTSFLDFGILYGIFCEMSCEVRGMKVSPCFMDFSNTAYFFAISCHVMPNVIK